MKTAWYILRHPVEGFWRMKYESLGRLSHGLVLLALAVLAEIFNRQARAFIFNDQYNVPLSLAKEIGLVLLPVGLFCLANWVITTLMDGKGTMKDIFLVTCYSLLPLILFWLGTPLISHLLSLNDAAYLHLLDAFGYLWMGLMVFIGIQQVHEYSFGRMFSTLLLTLVSALIVVFIALLFFFLLQELYAFLYSIYRELSLRL